MGEKIVRIDNDIYSIVDACLNACEMWKAIERSQQSTRNRGKAIVTSSAPTYDPEPATVTEEWKQRNKGYRAVNVAGAWENVGTLVVQKSGIQCYNCKELWECIKELSETQNETSWDWKDDMMYESDDQELGSTLYVHAQIQEEHSDTNITIDSLDICYDRVQDDQDDTDDLDQERDLLASLIQKLKCEIDDSKNRNKFLESSNKALVDKLKGEIEDFKTKNKSLESSNNHFKEANNELSKTNQLMFKDLKKFQAELDKYNDVNYASKVEIDCAKAKGDLMSYKIDFEKSSNAYTQKINDLNQTISDMKKELCAHQETISIMSQAKEAQIKLYKTREDKELDKVIALENKVKVLNDIVYKTGQSVQTMNMLNRNCKTSFAKPEFLKKAQRANPRLYDIGCYNDNLALMLAPDSDETIRLDKERQSKLSDLIRPFDYDQLNNLYDLFVPQREKSAEQHYFPKTSKMSHTSSNTEFSKESFRKQTTLLEKRMDESIPWDQKCKSSKELFKIKKSVDTIFDGVERCKQTIAKRTYFGNIDPFIQNTIEGNFGLCLNEEKFQDLCLNEEMVSFKTQCGLRKLKEILCKEKIKNDKSLKENQSNVFLKEREQYFEIQDLKAQLQDKGIALNDFMSPLPEGWSIRSIVWSIVLGEREEDSFVLINLSRKVVEYNLISKTLCEIYDMGPNQVADDYLDGFISPFAMYDMGS
ncbi:hypothetical protein Tco_0459570 [Tanacetum coccineum]